ncbi:MAG: hypothetical protein ACI4IF_08235 [Acutalibacteraceae bacterium]
MTLNKAIENFDSERVNSVSLETKIRWINSLDMKIFSEILYPRGYLDTPDYTVLTLGDTELKAPEEYSEIYTLYLNMRLDLQNGEIARYNNSAMLFNRMYKDMFDFINREEAVSYSNTIKASDYYV